MSHVTTSQEMTEKSKEYFEKIVELTKKEGIALALISGPYLLEERDQEVYNSIGQLAEKMDCCSGTLIHLPIIGRWGWTFRRICRPRALKRGGRRKVHGVSWKVAFPKLQLSRPQGTKGL